MDPVGIRVLVLGTLRLAAVASSCSTDGSFAASDDELRIHVRPIGLVPAALLAVALWLTERGRPRG